MNTRRLQEELIDSYINDGYIYCILPKSNDKPPVVKIGKTICEKNLLARYSTYLPGCSILLCKRTGNLHLAEKMVFKELTSIHYENEWFHFNEDKIESAFKKAIDKYPSVETLLNSCYDLNLLNRANRDIRVIKKSP